MGAKVTAQVNYFFPYEIKRISWNSSMKFCWWPRRCFFSNKQLWLKKCYVGEMLLRYDSQLLTTTVYAEKNQFIIHALSQ